MALRDRHGWIRLEISCRTVWSRNSGLSRRPVSCHLLLSTSTANFWRTIFRARPPLWKLTPPLVLPTPHPTPKSTPFVQTMTPKNDQTVQYIHHFSQSISTTSIFWLHNINCLPATPGGVSFHMGGLLGQLDKRETPILLLSSFLLVLLGLVGTCEAYTI